MLLGRLGHELAQMYRDTLHAPLPSALTALMDQLEAALRATEGGGIQPASLRQRLPR